YFKYKEIIELFSENDMKYNTNHSLYNYYPYNKICSFNDFYNNLLLGCKGKLKCQKAIKNSISSNEIYDSIYRCNKAKEYIDNKACPLALVSYYEIYRNLINSKIDQQINFISNNNKDYNYTELFDHCLQLEYNLMLNLMH